MQEKTLAIGRIIWPKQFDNSLHYFPHMKSCCTVKYWGTSYVEKLSNISVNSNIGISTNIGNNFFPFLMVKG